jgi:four helix bundle protein
MIKPYQDLQVYQASYHLAMDLFKISKSFPKEESYSLTSQLVRSSRSICANIAEGWSKRHYENKFKVHLIDSLGSTGETQNWFSFAKDCKYISEERFKEFEEGLNHIGKMLTKLHQNCKSNEKD